MAANNDLKFRRALERESCDIIDSMIEAGYIPETHTIVEICRRGNLDLLNTILSYFDNARKEIVELQPSGDLLDQFDSTLKQSLNDGFLAAVENGHVQFLNRLYLSGVDVNISSTSGNTALHKTTDFHTCRWLLDMGVRQVSSHNGQTPVHVACSHRRNEVLKLLLEYPEGRESLIKYDNSGKTPIHAACGHRRNEVLKLLLEYPEGRESPIEYENFGKPPIHTTCSFMRLEVIELILQYPEGRQSLTMLDKWRNTPLGLACKCGPLDTVRAMLRYPEGRQTINERDIRGQTPLQCARARGDDELVELLSQYL